MNKQEQDWLDAMRECFQTAECIKIETVFVFGYGMHEALRVFSKSHADRRWKKVGPLLFPPENGTTADTLSTLSSLMREMGR